MSPLTAELAQAAARLVVEEGLEYGAAKRRAGQQSGRTRAGGRGDWPRSVDVEDAVREYLAIYCADTQPAELRALRNLALRWMARLADFRPHLSGAVWRGTATRLSDVHLDLYCDDPKGMEIALINQGIDYESGIEPSSHPGHRGEPVNVLSLAEYAVEIGETVALHLAVRDFEDLRGALKLDARGRSWRGDATALRRLLDASDTAPAR